MNSDDSGSGKFGWLLKESQSIHLLTTNSIVYRYNAMKMKNSCPKAWDLCTFWPNCIATYLSMAQSQRILFVSTFVLFGCVCVCQYFTTKLNIECDFSHFIIEIYGWVSWHIDELWYWNWKWICSDKTRYLLYRMNNWNYQKWIDSLPL